jgi:arylsulfatase A-like enzyme
MDDGVIIDGQNIDLPLNLRTIADHFSDAGWNTSAYGKWLVASCLPCKSW